MVFFGRLPLTFGIIPVLIKVPISSLICITSTSLSDLLGPIPFESVKVECGRIIIVFLFECLISTWVAVLYFLLEICRELLDGTSVKVISSTSYYR